MQDRIIEVTSEPIAMPGGSVILRNIEAVTYNGLRIKNDDLKYQVGDNINIEVFK